MVSEQSHIHFFKSLEVRMVLLGNQLNQTIYCSSAEVSQNFSKPLLKISATLIAQTYIGKKFTDIGC